MKPEPKVFTKDAPCSKFDIWQCFRSTSGFVAVRTVVAQSIIGLNVPRIMEREGRLVREEMGGVEFYALTPEGKAWLMAGFQAYLKNHPAHVALAKALPISWGYTAHSGRLRRTR